MVGDNVVGGLPARDSVEVTFSRGLVHISQDKAFGEPTAVVSIDSRDVDALIKWLKEAKKRADSSEVAG